jgi:RYK receptor-like tyrosine kinase
MYLSVLPAVNFTMWKTSKLCSRTERCVVVFVQLPYVIAVDVSNKEALDTPRLNVSTEGSVPTTPQTFRVALPCSGVKDAEVNVTLSINITLHRASNNVTSLAFKRRKICLKGESVTVPY